jgi:hypothetical protein
MSGRGDMFISPTLDDPYAIEFADGQRVDVSDGVRSYSNSEIGKESESITDVPVIQLSLKIKRTDLASRGVFLAFVVGLLAAAWVGVINLGRIVQSTIAGRPFADKNPRRLRWLGGRRTGPSGDRPDSYGAIGPNAGCRPARIGFHARPRLGAGVGRDRHVRPGRGFCGGGPAAPVRGRHDLR